MDVELLEKVDWCLIAAGLAVPLLQIVAGAVGGALNLDVDFDGDVGDGPFPVNLMSLALFAVLTGAIGRLSLRVLPWWASILTGVAAGVAGAYLLGRFVLRPLRRNRADAQNIRQLRWTTGTVKQEIREDFVGTVTLLSSVGSLVTYSAKPISGVEKIGVGEQVMVVEVDEEKRVLTVSPLKKHE